MYRMNTACKRCIKRCIIVNYKFLILAIFPMTIVKRNLLQFIIEFTISQIIGERQRNARATKILFMLELPSVPRAIHQITNILARKIASIAITKAAGARKTSTAGARSGVESYRYLSRRNPRSSQCLLVKWVNKSSGVIHLSRSAGRRNCCNAEGSRIEQQRGG